jgi:hypothetical protein
MMDRNKIISDFEERCHFTLGMITNDKYRYYVQQLYDEVIGCIPNNSNTLKDDQFKRFFRFVQEADFLSCFEIMVIPKTEKVKHFRKRLSTLIPECK